MKLIIEGNVPLRGDVTVPADKSMTHRALMFGALAEGESTISAESAGEDNHSTARVLRDLGVSIEHSGNTWRVKGVGPQGLKTPRGPLDCGNSGTTMRLMSGVLAGAGVTAELFGDASLSKRPMGRICRPLRALGAKIEGQKQGEREIPPVRISGSGFIGGELKLEIASAQVKSSLLLAGLTAQKAVTVYEPSLSRDHTERMFNAMGARVETENTPEGVRIHLAANAKLSARDLQVAGDISSAAFLLAAGVMVPGSDVRVRNVGVNASRTGILEIFEEYGAKVSVSDWREVVGEPVGTLSAQASALKAERAGGGPTDIHGAIIPKLIDELVVLAGVASQAQGTTLVRDAQELRVKESDRVRETIKLLAAFGVKAEEREDGYVVHGPQPLRAAHVDVSADHRLALAGAVFALAAPGTTTLEGFEIASVSYPSFVDTLKALGARVTVA